MKIAGVVLAGGQSSRYGKPKMFATYQGRPFYEYSVDAFQASGLSPVVIATNSELRPFFNRTDLHYHLENNPLQGPLHAMYDTFASLPDTEWFFVLSCDVPYVTPDFVRRILTLTNQPNIDAIVPTQPSRIHPLMALYHRRTIPHMQELIASGQRKMLLLLDRLRVDTVPFSEDEPALMNINRPQDLQPESAPGAYTRSATDAE